MTNLYIYLNSKLITCDTILPFINDLKKLEPNINVVFYVFDKKTYDVIRQNINLKNLINNNGKLVLFGYFYKYKLIRIFFKIINILNIIIISFFYKTVNIHFKALEYLPFSLIYFFNKKNTYLFEGNCWGWSDIAYKSSIMFYKNRINTDQESFNSYQNLVCFSKEWPQYNFAKKNKKNIYLINSTRISKNWLEECSKQAALIYSEKPTWLKQIKNSNTKGIVFILGHMGKLPLIHETSTVEDLFKETIKLLIENTDLVILLKPHAITDINIVKNILNEYECDRVHIVYNHVAVISNFCDYAISNYFSFAIIDAWLNGCKTIEYTHYSEHTLKLTNNMSQIPKYIDIFINKNLNILKIELNKKFIKKKRFLSDLNDDTNLLYKAIL